jgi:thiosulfate reductase cytochrome b subunit
MKKVYIYKSFERFWHWTQSFLIFFLLITGFEIHGTISFFGYMNAVNYHNYAATAFIVLIMFAIFWHFTTGEWRQYIPTMKNIKAQVNYYIFGIFNDAPHPVKKTTLSKLNPLQKLVYAGLKILVIPVMVASGLMYMFYRYPQKDQIEIMNIGSIEPVALVHTAGAFLLTAFVIAHLYLITTGSSPLSNLKAMISGYEEMEEEMVKKSAAEKEIEIKEEKVYEYN